ncbi:MAG: glycoside hydrolase family 71/99-like protein [bacterium]|nr:glycoside hydrolase family 71/99-like protein [bacterium]
MSYRHQPPTFISFAILLLSMLLSVASIAQPPVPPQGEAPANPPRAAAIDRVMQPYGGPGDDGTGSIVDRTTLTGKVMCGYQGWFAAPGDGAGRGFYHYQRRGAFEPGRCTIDYWPDVRELDLDERYDTPFRHADGRVAQVFSAQTPKTVQRHFHWMRAAGIDGVFVQRFAGEVKHSGGLLQFTTVLANCREAANRTGRIYAVMYDLSSPRPGSVDAAIDDWKRLVDQMRIGRDPADKAYLFHRGRPLVAVWGVGFSDGRPYSLDDCARLVDFLKNDPCYGGNSVMLGVPTWWRTLTRDSVADPRLHAVLQQADVVSPWTVGRYRTPQEAADHIRTVCGPDLAWCRERSLDYLPVVFPGFSWHNMKPDSPLDQIPRLKGRFFWAQFQALRGLGIDSAYVAMFDEMDEGTAIFKCANDPPVGASPFLTFEGLSPDFYMKLAGQGGRLLRREPSSPDDPLPPADPEKNLPTATGR